MPYWLKLLMLNNLDTTPAETYQKKHWFTGKMKTRCVVCGKVTYPDQQTAESRATMISERTPMRAYKGSECHHWHVCRIRERKRRCKRLPISTISYHR